MAEPPEERAFRIGVFAGAPVVVEPAFLLLAAFVVGSAALEDGLGAVPGALAFVGVLFAAVLIHELGHAGAAAALRIRAKRIVVTFFGGYVSFAEPLRKRWHEIVVSAAGPAANLACWPLALAAARALGADAQFASAEFHVALQLQNFAFVSALLGVFNLFPGHPLDGGHVLRAALSYVMAPARAGAIAAGLGVVVAAGLIVFALWRQLIWTAFIGGLLALAAWAEFARLRRLAAQAER